MNQVLRLERSTPRSLHFSEWLLIGFFLAFLFSLFFISNVFSSKAGVFLSPLPPIKKVFVEIVGEVKRPGRYEFEAGVSCEEVLKKAGLKYFSDLSPFDLNAPAPLFMTVLKLREIHVSVEGEVVNPYSLVVDPGTRICDLKSKICVKESGDISIFRSRKMIADGQKIWIHKKK